MLKLLKRLGKYWWLVGALILTTAINVVADCALPNFLGKIIDFLQRGEAVKIIAECAAYMLLVALVSGLSAMATCKFASMITARMVAETRYELFKKIGDFSSNEMNKYSVSSLVTRTTGDLTIISNAYNLVLRYMIYGPAISIVAIILLLAQGSKVYQLATYVLAAVVVMIIFIIIVVIISVKKFQEIQVKLDKVTLITRENLEGLRVVRAYNAEQYQEEKFIKHNNTLMKTEVYANRGLGLLTPGIQLIVGVLNVLIYWTCTKLVPEGGIDFPMMSIVIQYAALILTGFIMITIIIVQLPRAMVCAKRVNQVIETTPDVQDPVEPKEGTEVGTIEFKNVTFTYPGAEKPVLENISFKANRGETIAFIGATGSGKTTLINLLPRFFDCTEGEVLVDGLNVKDYQLSTLFSKFGYVPQKGYLFHASMHDNIVLGKPDATKEQIDRALDISQSKEFVEKIPQGLDYEISQGGKNVSGGQRQRLCIARAIIMEPEIFIFDDSFSALDYRTDKVLRGEIKKQCAGTTNVIVAQRVGTIMDADQIIVLDNGQMVGKGTHKELLKNCPVYKEIALSQLSKEELE